MTSTLKAPTRCRLVDQFERGLDAPICLTWELTYAHQPGLRALPVVVGQTGSARAEHRAVQGDHRRSSRRMQVFYVNIGGGEPTVRPGLLGAGRLRHRTPWG